MNTEITYLVTGGSGFLGRHIIAALLHDGILPQNIRALVRSPSLWLEKSGVNIIYGDLCDACNCAAAVSSVDYIYHSAGMVSRHPDDSGRLFQLHVEGTRLLLAAFQSELIQRDSRRQSNSKESAVHQHGPHSYHRPRVLLVSTSGTIAVSKEKESVADEQTPYQRNVVAKWPYYLSKIYQEELAFAEASKENCQYDLVVVNPSLLLGPGDIRGSSSGDVELLLKGKLPLIPTGGGIAFVDVRDAASGALLAMKKGRANERYLLSASNMTTASFFGRLARLAQVTRPRAVTLPKKIAQAGVLLESVFRWGGLTPPINQQSLEMSQHTWYCDPSKAQEELGWCYRDPQETLQETVSDLKARLHL